MSIQVGKFTRAMSLTPNSTQIVSDTVNIPYVGTNYKDGTVTTITTKKLIDSSSNFLTTGANALSVKVGDIVWNTSAASSGAAYVTNIDSATQLTLSTDIFALVGNSYRLFSASDLYFGSTIPCYLYVSTTGSLKILTPGGDIVTFSNVIANTILPVQAVRLYTGSNAGGVIALW